MKDLIGMRLAYSQIHAFVKSLYCNTILYEFYYTKYTKQYILKNITAQNTDLTQNVGIITSVNTS